LASDADNSCESVPANVNTDVADDAPTDPMARAFLNEVIMGLLDVPKGLPPKWFYDETGTKLFEEICEQPEYYPTEQERAIVKQAAPEIAAILSEEAVLIEFGSGAMSKLRTILDELSAHGVFVAVDISAEQLEGASETLSDVYPNLKIVPIAEDFTRPVTLPDGRETLGRKCVFFPGSTMNWVATLTWMPSIMRRITTRRSGASKCIW